MDNSIDPFFCVHDGSPYLFWGSWNGIHGIELTDDGLDWIEGTRFQVAGDAYEAPWLVERDGYFYLFLSTGHCCNGHDSSYEIEVGRSESLFGPYHDRNGTDLREIDEWHEGSAILTSGEEFVGPGHNATLTDEDGGEWLVYHAYDTTAPEYECDEYPRRSLLLDRIHWSDGWPEIGDRNGTPSRYPQSAEREDTE